MNYLIFLTIYLFTYKSFSMEQSSPWIHSKVEKHQMEREFAELLQKYHLSHYFKALIENGVTTAERLLKLDHQAVKSIFKTLVDLRNFSDLLKMKGTKNCHELYSEYNIVTIGINDYQNKSLESFNGCVNDALAIEKLFGRKGFMTRCLLNSFARKDDIERLLDELRDTLVAKNQDELSERNKNGLLIIYFSGHGFETGEGKNREHYLCPYDFNPHALNATGLNLRKLRNECASYNCKHVLLILDCFFSEGLFENNNKLKSLENNILSTVSKTATWAITAGKKITPNRELKINDITRGIFSYHLEQILSFGDHSLFSNAHQIRLNQGNDKNREFFNVVFPVEIIEALEKELSNPGHEFNPLCASIEAEGSERNGIPVIGQTCMDFLAIITKEEADSIKKAQNDKESILFFNKNQTLANSTTEDKIIHLFNSAAQKNRYYDNLKEKSSKPFLIIFGEDLLEYKSGSGIYSFIYTRVLDRYVNLELLEKRERIIDFIRDAIVSTKRITWYIDGTELNKEELAKLRTRLKQFKELRQINACLFTYNGSFIELNNCNN